jgi:ribosome-associated toxin RatA of RatAB toxin-antitoxin module
MSHIQRTALVHYSPQEMFDLVNDVRKYPDFLPWCRSSRLISETETEMEASIEIAKGVLNKTFTTRNRLTRGRKIELQLVNGPFRKLTGFWEFLPLKTEQACRVNLDLEFEFDSAMMSIAAKPVFTQIANSLVDAFVKRAVDVYGERF